MGKFQERQLVKYIGNYNNLSKGAIYTVTSVHDDSISIHGFGQDQFPQEDFEAAIPVVKTNWTGEIALMQASSPLTTAAKLEVAEAIKNMVSTKRQGSKFDSKKPKIRFLSREFMEGVASAQTFGSQKYGDWNFQKGLETTALYDAAMRHMMAWMSGEDNDPESGLSHLAHAGANLNMLMWTLANKPEMDDRPKNDSN